LATSDKKAEKLFNSAVDYYQRGDLDRALTDLARAAEQDPLFTEAYILTGDINADRKQYEESIEAYQKAIATNRPFAPNLWYVLANTQLTIGRYADARNNFQRYLDSKNIPAEKLKRITRALEQCDFGIQCTNNPVPFQPVNLGDSINTPFDEYINAITADEAVLYFTRKQAKNSLTVDQTQAFEEDFYFSRNVDSVWQKAENLGPPINTHGNEGAMNISPDGKYLFFAACNRDDSYGSCDLYWAKRMGDRWTEPENMGPVVNSTTWDSQPSFSSDGKTLYFSSKRPGGKGSSDIWKTTLLPDGQWTPPVNLGDSINTPWEEMAPFIHPDDQTLYFSSKGHPGMGGFDLFYSRKDISGNWKKPVNLGYPINTFSDEITLVVNARGDIAYISSDKLGGKGKQDIYKFRLYKEAQPLLTTYFKGVVYDAETREKLEARFELTDIGTSRIVAEAGSVRLSGEFLLVLPSERNYALNVSRDGYLFYSDNFLLTGNSTRTRPFIKNIPLKPIRVGETVILKNIFFDTDKYSLKEESFTELEKLIRMLQKNPKLRIEISGHTDNAGTPEHNLELSANRAKTVYEYLVGHGITKERMTWAGYGLTRPIDLNTTEAGRANNRRTEFRVIGN